MRFFELKDPCSLSGTNYFSFGLWPNTVNWGVALAGTGLLFRGDGELKYSSSF